MNSFVSIRYIYLSIKALDMCINWDYVSTRSPLNLFYYSSIFLHLSISYFLSIKSVGFLIFIG